MSDYDAAVGRLTDAAVGLPEPFGNGCCTYCGSAFRGSHFAQCPYARLVLATDAVLRGMVAEAEHGLG